MKNYFFESYHGHVEQDHGEEKGLVQSKTADKAGSIIYPSSQKGFHLGQDGQEQDAAEKDVEMLPETDKADLYVF